MFGQGRVRGGRRRSSRVEGLAEVGDEVVGGLDADGQADQRGVDRERRVDGRRVGHARRVLDERLDAAERLRQREQPRAGDDLERGSSPPAARKLTMPPKSRICAARDCVAGMVGECRVEHASTPRGAAAACVTIAPARSRSAAPCAPASVLMPAQHEVAVERARHRADRVLQEPEALGDLGIAGGDEPADDVGVTAEVLGGRVHHDVGAELERPLQERRGERVVDDDARAALVRDRAHAQDVDDRERGVGGRLDPHRARCRRASRRSSASRSVRSATVHSMPAGASTFDTRRNVPPYASSGMTTRWPGASSRSTASSAAMPLANAKPSIAPSSDARHSSYARRVGLPLRAYS